jgi:hypothetical protein
MERGNNMSTVWCNAEYGGALPWLTRVKILLGAAKGLEFLGDEEKRLLNLTKPHSKRRVGKLFCGCFRLLEFLYGLIDKRTIRSSHLVDQSFSMETSIPNRLRH